VLLETNAGLVTQAHYTDFPGYWGGLVSESRSGTSSFFGFDSQNNTRILVSIAGLVTDNYSYKAFGEELASGSETTNPYRYIGGFGYYRDVATRQYVRARHLAVTNGRWTSRDPRGFAGGDWNLYRYGANNPGTWLDPSGQVLSVHARNCPKWIIGQAPPKNLNCCGIFDTFWKFLLSDPAAQKGYIVQKVTVSGRVLSCQGVNAPPIPLPFTYLEAWEVPQHWHNPVGSGWAHSIMMMNSNTVVFLTREQLLKETHSTSKAWRNSFMRSTTDAT